MVDLKWLYDYEIVSVKGRDGEEIFQATVRQISNGDKADAQAQMLAAIELPTGGTPASRKQKIKREMEKAMQSGISAKISLFEEVAAIETWTLTDPDGDPVPVTVETWRALPEFLSKQIVSSIERLNPEMDQDFRGHDDSEGDE